MTQATDEQQTNMTPGDYIVVATQLNRRVPDPDVDGGYEFVTVKRGETLPDDVTPAELKRWIGMTRPPVIKTRAELEAAAVTAADQAALIADLQAQLAEANSKLADAEAAGAEHAPDANGDGVLEEPAGNASRSAWAEYATQQAAGDADALAWINDTENVSRDDLRDRYKGA